MELNFKKLGQGPPVIILHGFLGTLDNWITIARQLMEDYTVYLVDQRNHGFSPHTPEHDLKLMANDLHEFMGTHDIEDAILVGHSMGGKVIMQYAADHKDNFRKLVVVDIAPRKYPPHHMHIFEALFSLDLSSMKSRNEANESLSVLVKHEGTRQFLLKNLDRTREGFRWKANLEVLEKSQESIAYGIEGENLTDKPVYFIRGDQSDYVVPEDREQIKKLFPQARILTIKKAGHWVHVDHPVPFLKTLKAILGS